MTRGHIACGCYAIVALIILGLSALIMDKLIGVPFLGVVIGGALLLVTWIWIDG